MPARPRSNSYCSSIKDFHIGSPVKIVDTENVAQRHPDLIGKVGIVHEVPVHPVTWFKVKFSDGSIVTFRPSALKSVNDDDFYDSDIDPASVKSASIFSRNQSPVISAKIAPIIGVEPEKLVLNDLTDQENQVDKSQEILNFTGSSTDKVKLPATLQNIHPDLWVGSTVVITAGRNLSEKGIIHRTGNGWIQVLLNSHEEVAKRITELKVIEMPPISCKTGKLREDVLKFTKERNQQLNNRLQRKALKKTISSDCLAHSGNNASDSDNCNNVDDLQGLIDQDTRDNSDQSFSRELHWRKRFRESLDIDNRYRPRSDDHSSSRNVCPTCFTERNFGSRICWNETCLSCPNYSEKCSSIMAPTLKLKPVLTIPSETGSPRFETSPTSANNSVFISISSAPSTPYSPVKIGISNAKIYDLVSPSVRYSHSFEYGEQTDRSYKSRSDSSITDREVASPIQASAVSNNASTFSTADDMDCDSVAATTTATFSNIPSVCSTSERYYSNQQLSNDFLKYSREISLNSSSSNEIFTAMNHE